MGNYGHNPMYDSGTLPATAALAAERSGIHDVVPADHWDAK